MSEDELTKIVLDGLKNPPTTSKALYQWIYALTGEHIPFTSVCPDHQTPWDMLWRSFRIDIPEWKSRTKKNLVAVGCRNGQKTLTLAKLIVAEMLLKPNAGTLGMGATQTQANRCFTYASRYMRNPAIGQSDIIRKMLNSYMELENESSYEQVVATPSGTNSAHKPKLRVDEVDLIKPEVLEEAKMMPVSMAGLSSHTIYISTRKYLEGNMDNMVKAAGKMDYDTVIWCYKEVSEPCPESRRGNIEKVYEVEDIDNPGETVVVKAFTGCEKCPLLPTCRGDLAKSKGYVPIEDTIDEFLKLDRHTWITQKECKEPKRGNIFFDEWSHKLQAIEFGYNPDLPVDLSFDFTNGGDSPTVCDIWQEDESGNNYLLAALEYAHMTTDAQADGIVQFLKDLGIKREKIRTQVGDSAQMQMIKDFNSRYPDWFSIVPCKKIHRRDGWPLCRKLVRNNSGDRKLFVNVKWSQPFINEIEKAKRSKTDPDDISKLSAAHHLDSWRYREVKLRYRDGAEPRIRLLLPPGYKEEGTKILPLDNNPDLFKEGKPRTLMDRVWDYMRDEDND